MTTSKPLSQASCSLEHENQRLACEVEALDRHRRLLGHDLHDGLAQLLTAAHLQMQAHVRRLEDVGAADLPREHLDEAIELVCRAMAETRRLIAGLVPAALAERGLVDALADLIREQSARGEAAFELDLQPTAISLAPAVEAAVYRVVQESTNNIVRHARARHARVEIKQGPRGVELEISDDGVGFEPEEIPEACRGVRGIAERAELLGGRARVVSRPGETRVLVWLPTQAPGRGPYEGPGPRRIR